MNAELEGAWGMEVALALAVDALRDETIEAVRTRFLGLTVGALVLVDMVREMALVLGAASAFPPEKLTLD